MCILSYEKLTITGEHLTDFAWNVILWLKVSDSSLQSFLTWLKWYIIPSQIHVLFYLCPINRNWLKLHANVTTSHIFHNGWPRIEFQAAVCTCTQIQNRWKVHNVLLIGIYEFNIYLFFKRRGRRLLERGTSSKEYSMSFILSGVRFTYLIYLKWDQIDLQKNLSCIATLVGNIVW